MSSSLMRPAVVTPEQVQTAMQQATLTEATVYQIAQKVIQAMSLGYAAEVALVIDGKGRLRFIKGPIISDPVVR